MTSLQFIEVPRPDQNTIWASKEFGIRSRSEFEKYIPRNFIQKVGDLGTAWASGGYYTVSAAAKRVSAQYTKLQAPKFDDTTPVGTDFKVDKLGLALLFHGLNGQPSVWDNHISLLKKNELDIYAPEVPDGGHKSIEDETSYILLNRIVDWTKRNPGKPICIFGQSNGSRLALLFEVWLRTKAPETPVYVSLTAGVLFGTSGANVTNNLLRTDGSNSSIISGMISQENGLELPFGSDMARKLVGEARKPLEKGTAERHYCLYAPLLPAIDLFVPDTGSSLPILVPDEQTSKSEKHYLIPNHGHNAMVTVIAERQVAECLEWLKSKNKT